MQEQAEAGDDSVDYLHDIPIEVAKSACGYRADDWLPPFVGLRAVKAAASQPAAAGGGLLGGLKRLFSGGR